jgi:hypothetical protein
MPETHAMAMVSWEEYRRNTADHYRPPEFFYCSKQKNLIRFVGDGGTLWAVTSRAIDGEKRYSLAFKLINCVQQTPSDKKREKYGPYMVQSSDWRHCQYYSFGHDATDTLRLLRFDRPAPMPSFGRPGKIGSYLQTISKLAEGSVGILQGYEEKILSQRKVFISYAHEDEGNGSYLTLLERGLQNENVNTWSDLSGLRAGDDWRPALKRVASNTDCILVLVSKASAQSDWVQREIQWAINAYRTTQFVKLIIPILLDSASLEKFDNLGSFQSEKWDNSRNFYRKLAERIIDATSSGYTGFREDA